MPKASVADKAFFRSLIPGHPGVEVKPMFGSKAAKPSRAAKPSEAPKPPKAAKPSEAPKPSEAEKN